MRYRTERAVWEGVGQVGSQSPGPSSLPSKSVDLNGDDIPGGTEREKPTKGKLGVPTVCPWPHSSKAPSSTPGGSQLR